MEGRYFAVSTALLAWSIGYFISLYFFTFKYSKGIIPNKWREKTTDKTMTYYLIGTPIITGIIAGTAYRIGGMMERGNGIRWGCYIEYFLLGSFALLFFTCVGTSILLIIALIKPKIFKIENRIDALLLFLIHNLYVLILPTIISLFIHLLSGPLTGKGGSCL